MSDVIKRRIWCARFLSLFSVSSQSLLSLFSVSSQSLLSLFSVFSLVLILFLTSPLFVSAQSLPTVSGSSNTWGTELNTFLNVSLDVNGTIRNNTINTQQINDSVVTAAKINASAVNTTHIVDGTIAAADLASSSVNATHIVDGTIAAADLTSDLGLGWSNLSSYPTGCTNQFVTTVGDTLTCASVAAASITDGSIAAADLASSSVNATHIVDGTITATDLATAIISAVYLAASSVNATHIVDATITAADLATGIISAVYLATSSVNSTHIVDGTITVADLTSDLGLGWGNLSSYPTGCTNQFVTTLGDALTCASVAAASITDGSIAAADLASGSVNSTHIVTDTIVAEDIAADAVGASEIGADVVDGTELADTITLDAMLTINSQLINIGGCAAGLANGDNDLCVQGDLEVDTNLRSDGTTDLNGLVDIDVSSGEALQVDGGLVDIGSGSGSCTIATGVGELCVSADLEVNANARIDGTLTVADAATLAGLNVTGSCADPGEAFGTCATNVDYAELYVASEAVEQGSLVSIDDSKEDLSVKTTKKVYDGSVIGIVSTSPAMVIEGNGVQIMQNYTHNPLKPAIAMAGRVPVKVSNENGAIKPGDLLVPSSTPGYAMKCNEKIKCFGSVVGKALESFGGRRGKITALVMMS